MTGAYLDLAGLAAVVAFLLVTGHRATHPHRLTRATARRSRIQLRRKP